MKQENPDVFEGAQVAWELGESSIAFSNEKEMKL